LRRVDDRGIVGKRLLVCRILRFYPSERVKSFWVGIRFGVTRDGPTRTC
jgi:hypothetical protein